MNDIPIITEPPVHGMVTLPHPVRHIQCWRFHKKLILNVRGNVDEFTSVPGITTRKVFSENSETLNILIPQEVNSYTGFRNVMTLRLWIDNQE